MVEEKTSLFVTCAAGLEPLLTEELHQLGLVNIQSGYRGVYVDGWSWESVYKINYGSRLASRVLLPLHRFKCFDRHSLYREMGLIDWSQFIKSKQTFAIDANVHHKQLRNSLFAAQVVKDAICDQIRKKTGQRPSINVNDPDVQLNLYIQNNMGVISFDTSGAPLHKRGYRQESVEAPLQENLAAAILKLARYKKEDILLDPCCGSGTILIEAALIATQTPPGYLRRKWGFMNHPKYNPLEWLRVKNDLDQHRQSLVAGSLFGIDIGREATRVCKINLKSAGFQYGIDIKQHDFRDFVPEKRPTIIMTNPPYGKRLEEESHLVPLYGALGDFMKQQCSKPGRGFIFTGNLELAKCVGLAASKRYVLSNGGIDSRLLEYEIY